jgi:hypothetical protein
VHIEWKKFQGNLMKLDNTKYPMFRHQQLTGKRLDRFRKNLIVDLLLTLIIVPIFLAWFVYSDMDVRGNLLRNLMLIVGIPTILLIIYRLVRGEMFWQLKRQERQINKK